MTWLISRVQVYHQRYHLLVPKSTIQTDIDNLEYYHIDLHIRKIKRSISFEARPVYRCTVYQPQAFVSIEGQSPNFSFTNPRIRRNLRDFNIFDGKWRHENFSVKGFFVEEKLRPKLHNGQTPNTTRQPKNRLSQDTGHFNRIRREVFLVWHVEVQIGKPTLQDQGKIQNDVYTLQDSAKASATGPKNWIYHAARP